MKKVFAIIGILILSTVFLLGCNEQDENLGYSDLTAAEAKEKIDSNPGIVIIEVSPHYDDGHIPGAVHYYGDNSLDDAIPTQDKEKEYLVYCHADGPSISASNKLANAGFTMVYRLEDNYQAWVDAGYPIET